MVLDRLKEAVAELEEADDCDLDPKVLSTLIDRLQAKFCQVANRARERGDHLLNGNVTAVGWIANTCGMSRNSAGDRLCVGKQLGELPKVAEALRTGQISYQAASVICHLRDKLGERGAELNEEQWVDYGSRFSIYDLNKLALVTRHCVDPDGFLRDANEDFERRQLFISQMNGMYVIDGTLDAEGGAALKTAIDALTKRHAPDDDRTPRQRRADALVELVYHAMDQGTLPKRNGVRPHITITTTLEGLKDELGAAASELEQGMPVSSQTVQRLACDGCLCRVLKADSIPIDVGRVTRAVSPSQKRALRARDKHCRFPGCDRPVSWTSPHHIEFWARGGSTNLPNLLSLCFFHHRCVHEGEWQVIKAGQEFRFIPPDRIVTRRTRLPAERWAA
jgi:hypothetical protein